MTKCQRTGEEMFLALIQYFSTDPSSHAGHILLELSREKNKAQNEAQGALLAVGHGDRISPCTLLLLNYIPSSIWDEVRSCSQALAAGAAEPLYTFLEITFLP